MYVVFEINLGKLIGYHRQRQYSKYILTITKHIFFINVTADMFTFIVSILSIDTRV